MHETSPSDFFRWARYLNQIDEEPTMDQWYLMQIVSEIVKKNLKPIEAKKIKIADYKLKTEEPKKKETLAGYLKRSKNFFSIFGKATNGD
jgi:hypothetical protein